MFPWIMITSVFYWYIPNTHVRFQRWIDWLIYHKPFQNFIELLSQCSKSSIMLLNSCTAARKIYCQVLWSWNLGICFTLMEEKHFSTNKKCRLFDIVLISAKYSNFYQFQSIWMINGITYHLNNWSYCYEYCVSGMFTCLCR